jgi:hypothetical protein
MLSALGKESEEVLAANVILVTGFINLGFYL